MDVNTIDSTLRQVRLLLEGDDIQQALDIIEGLLPADQADVFDELLPEQQHAVLPQLEARDAADILEELDDEATVDIASKMSAGDLAAIVDEMEPDKAADLLGDLDPAITRATLAQMQEADNVRPLLAHPDESAGGLMTSAYLAFEEKMEAAQALAVIAEEMPSGSESPYLYVVDVANRLVGVVNIYQMIGSPPETPLWSLMDPEVLTIDVGEDQETAARLMARYDLVSVPVVDDQRHLVGVITVDDLVEVLEEEASEDIYHIAGTGPLDRPYLDASILSAAWRRLGWLLLLFVTGTLTGTVMSLFENELSKAVALTLFVPLLIGTGGNAGSQSTATIIRALSVGEIDLNDSFRVLWRELRTSIILGLLLAAIAFVRAITWVDTTGIALVVASSIFAIVLWADCVGALLPLMAAKLKIDPTLVSGPLMSTLVDATGLLIYFSIARALLRL